MTLLAILLLALGIRTGLDAGGSVEVAAARSDRDALIAPIPDRLGGKPA